MCNSNVPFPQKLPFFRMTQLEKVDLIKKEVLILNYHLSDGALYEKDTIMKEKITRMMFLIIF